MTNYLKLLFISLLVFGLPSCKKTSVGVREGDEKRKQLVQYDQIYAQVNAKPNESKTGYNITIRNYGHSPISFWRNVTPQWREWDDPRSLKMGWNQESPPDTHDLIQTLAPEEETILEVRWDELGPIDGFVRFGVHFQCMEGDSYRKLTVWSRASPARHELRQHSAEQAVPPKSDRAGG